MVTSRNVSETDLTDNVDVPSSRHRRSRSRSVPRVPASVTCTLVSQHDSAMRFELPTNVEIIVGRCADASISGFPFINIESSATVSRLHATVTAAPNGDVWVHDNTSTNGTYLASTVADIRGGLRLHPQRVYLVPAGGAVMFGEVVMTVERTPVAPPQPRSTASAVGETASALPSANPAAVKLSTAPIPTPTSEYERGGETSLDRFQLLLDNLPPVGAVPPSNGTADSALAAAAQATSGARSGSSATADAPSASAATTADDPRDGNVDHKIDDAFRMLPLMYNSGGGGEAQRISGTPITPVAPTPLTTGFPFLSMMAASEAKSIPSVSRPRPPSVAGNELNNAAVSPLPHHIGRAAHSQPSSSNHRAYLSTGSQDSSSSGDASSRPPPAVSKKPPAKAARQSAGKAAAAPPGDAADSLPTKRSRGDLAAVTASGRSQTPSYGGSQRVSALIVCFSGMREQERDKATARITILGARFRDDWDPAVNAVVVPASPAVRTPKVLMAIGRGALVLTCDFLDSDAPFDDLERFVPAVQRTAGKPVPGKRILQRIEECRVSPALSGRAFTLTDVAAKSRAAAAEIIAACGGTVSRSKKVAPPAAQHLDDESLQALYDEIIGA